jgi:hypothetical protein
MLPTLWPGDLLTLESAVVKPVLPGEIVLFHRENRFFIHRVVGLSSTEAHGEVITCGDCMAQNDAPIAPAEVLGRLVEVCRGERIVFPAKELSWSRKALGQLLCRFTLLHRIALRWHATRESKYGMAIPKTAG